MSYRGGGETRLRPPESGRELALMHASTVRVYGNRGLGFERYRVPSLALIQRL